MKSPHRLTADKRVGSCRASPKLPSATSFIRRTLYAIGRLKKEEKLNRMSLAKFNNIEKENENYD